MVCPTIARMVCASVILQRVQKASTSPPTLCVAIVSPGGPGLARRVKGRTLRVDCDASQQYSAWAPGRSCGGAPARPDVRPTHLGLDPAAARPGPAHPPHPGGDRPG